MAKSSTKNREVQEKTVSVSPSIPSPVRTMDAFLSAASTATKVNRKKDRLYFEQREAEVLAGIDAQGNPLTKKVNIPILCDEFRVAKLNEEEYEEIKKEKISAIREVLDPWHDSQCRQGKPSGTIDIECDGYSVQFQYQEKFSLFEVGEKSNLQEAVGGPDNYNALFAEESTLVVSKAVMSNPDRFSSLIQKLQQTMTPDEFASFFEYTTKIKARPNFDLNRFAKLSDGQNSALIQAGLKQTVACKLMVEKGT
jgi:hypothetical protein